MNKQPVYYMQTDKRWKNKPYRVQGENATIGGSGCGPTCAAMLIETLTGKTYTPVDACNWSMQHGYKALGNGTYFSYFPPQFAAFGLSCTRLTPSNIYGKPSSPYHTQAFTLLKQGNYIIACMGPGLWTSGGHFVVVWWHDGKVYINDPASTRTERLRGDYSTFAKQVKLYWSVKIPKEEPEMTEQDVLRILNKNLPSLVATAVREAITIYTDEINPLYKDLKDVPSYWQDDVKALLDAGAINGGTTDNPTDLNLRKDTLAAAIIAARYHRIGEQAPESDDSTEGQAVG